MKAFTDLEQSKKLAEILPIESADQTWIGVAMAGANLNIPEEMQYRHNGDMPFQYYSSIGIPCWSLAALLDILHPNITLDHTEGEGWSIIMNIDVENHTSTEKVIAETPIDACVEMIIKLHEQKLL